MSTMIVAVNRFMKAWIEGDEGTFRSMVAVDLQIKIPAEKIDVANIDDAWSARRALGDAILNPHTVDTHSYSGVNAVNAYVHSFDKNSGARIEISEADFTFDVDGKISSYHQVNHFKKPGQATEPKVEPSFGIKSIDQVSDEELTAEFLRRGLTLPSTITTTTGRTVFNVLRAMEEWAKIDRHRNDKDRKLTQFWTFFAKSDWAKSPPGHCVDANKSVRVGLGEYSKYEDPNSSQILIISHYDTERPGNFRGPRDLTPVWAVAFSCEEMRELTANVILHKDAEGTLIHREPEGDIELDEPWFSETHWLIENDKITGLRIVVKCTQDPAPSIQLVRFKMRGSTFEKISVETLPEPPIVLPAATLQLPEAGNDVPALVVESTAAIGSPATGEAEDAPTRWRVIDDDGINVREGLDLSTSVTKRLSKGEEFETTEEKVSNEGIWRLKLSDGSGWTSKFHGTDNYILVEKLSGPDLGGNTAGSSNSALATEGDSLLQMRFVSGCVSTMNFRSGDELSQTIDTPKLAIMNPTDKKLDITRYWVDFLKNDGETWARGSNTRVGQQAWSGNYVNWVDVQTFSIPEHESLEIFLQGTWNLPADLHPPAYGGRPHCMRIHSSFPDPLKARATIEDDTGNTKTIYFQASNPPLPHSWTSYEDAVAACPASDGFGPDYQPEIWLCVENPFTLNKCLIAVTTRKEDPHDWYVRVESGLRDISSNHSKVALPYFQRLGFKASLQPAASRPLEVDVDLGGDDCCKLTGLMDYDSKLVYALHGVIEIKDVAGNAVVKREAYMRLDYARVTPE